MIYKETKQLQAMYNSCCDAITRDSITRVEEPSGSYIYIYILNAPLKEIRSIRGPIRVDLNEDEDVENRRTGSQNISLWYVEGRRRNRPMEDQVIQREREREAATIGDFTELEVSLTYVSSCLNSDMDSD